MSNRIGLGLIAVALCAAACGGGQAAPPPPQQPGGGGPQIQLGAPFTMPAGGEAQIDGSSVRVRFDGVSDDSRCKPGQHCVWEGDATVHLTVGGDPVALHTSKRVKPQDATVQGYHVQLMGLTTDAEDATILIGKS